MYDISWIGLIVPATVIVVIFVQKVINK
jgi:ATP-binding cassette, subfamily C (CFTR/MRP), member 2